MTPAVAEATPAVAAPQRHRGGYGRYLLRKAGGSLASLAFVTVLAFFMFRVFLPGDPVKTLGRGRFSTEEQKAEFAKAYGLDQPLWEQFLTYLKNLAQGDFGISLRYRVPVSDLLLDRFATTLVLVGISTVLAMAIGVWMGIRGAWKRGGWFDRASTSGSLLLYSMPEWWLGLILMFTFATKGGLIPQLFPTGGLHTYGLEPWSFAWIVDAAKHLFLPVLTLTLAYLAEYTLVMRSSLLDEMGQDYLMTARAKGLRDVEVRDRHAVPNALLPTTTLIALSIGFVLTGAITVETIYSIPGLGLLGAEAISLPDYWVLQGTFLVGAAAVIVANFVANAIYGLLDPRVRS